MSISNKTNWPGPVPWASPIGPMMAAAALSLGILGSVGSLGCSPRSWLEGDSPQKQSETKSETKSEQQNADQSANLAAAGNGDPAAGDGAPSELGLNPAASPITVNRQSGRNERSQTEAPTREQRSALDDVFATPETIATPDPVASKSDDSSDSFARQPIQPRRAGDEAVIESPVQQAVQPPVQPPIQQPVQIDAGLAPDALADMIVQADRQTQAIVRDNGQTSDPTGDPSAGPTPQENRASLIRVLTIKRDAATALASHQAASAWQKIAGRRAQLQSLSGLASLGDQQAGDLLRYAAATESHSDSDPLAVDAHCILVALSVQSLVAGDQAAVDDILSHVKSIEKRIDPRSDPRTEAEIHDALSTLATLGAAREMLQKYGEDDAALRLRDVILENFAVSDVPQIAAVAAAAAGQAQYRTMDEMLIRLVQGDTVPMADWSEAVNELIDQSPDLQTVQYLAPSALELESYGRGDYADAIYRIMAKRFGDADSSAAAQVEIAIQAAEQRRSVIGREFRPQPSSLVGPPINLLDYRGKIVLMPFWSSRSPESVVIIDSLIAIAQSSPQRIAVVGMNLDLTEAQIRDLADSQAADSQAADSQSADSQSADSQSMLAALPPIGSLAGSASSESVNPIARQFGMVSLPFVAILDDSGIVSGFGYDPTSISQQVSRLLDSAAN